MLATQNPIETEGVYTLPEAQRDRFLLKVDVDHADELDELTIVQRMSVNPPRAEAVLSVEELVELQAVTDRVFVHHAVAHFVVQLVMATRHPYRYGLNLDGVLEYGVSARGSLGLWRPRVRWRCCGVGTTCCPTTWTTSPATSSPTGWC